MKSGIEGDSLEPHGAVPGLIVFDLDFTLWDCGGTWCDTLQPPFRRDPRGVWDHHERCVSLYPDVDRILQWCDDAAIPMALASRTEEPDWARELLDLLGVSHRFEHAEIYPSSKVKHFSALTTATAVPHRQMMFFDDEHRNIRECGELGVHCVHVPDGIHWGLFQDHVLRFADSPEAR